MSLPRIHSVVGGDVALQYSNRTALAVTRWVGVVAAAKAMALAVTVAVALAGARSGL